MNLVPLNSLFYIKYGNQFDLYKLDVNEKSNINFVSRQSYNLGVVCKVSKYKNIEPNPPGLITVTLGGTFLLSSFVQQMPFYTAQNIKILTPKNNMSFNEKVFYCKCIEKNRFRYTSHGREANITLDTLLVPDKVPIIYFNVKTDKLLTLDKKPINNILIYLNIPKWKYFLLSKFFNIKGSKTTSLLDLEKYGPGKYPYITTQASNNGVAGFYDYYTEEGNVLTVDSAVLGYCSYQSLPFSASDHVEKLIPKFNINKYIALFISTVINAEQYRYNYGRKCSQERMEKSQIKLPSKNNVPDFEFMENYIKSLSYSSSI
jgi:hypothetical protein